MNSTNQPLSATQQYQKITDKRRALESLVEITASIHRQQDALSELMLAAKPSQEFPAKTIQHFKAIEKQMASKSPEQLEQQLYRLEHQLLENIQQAMLWVGLDTEQLRNHQCHEVDFSSFNRFMFEFQVKTSTALGIRFLLKKMGKIIPSFHLPVTPDTISQQIVYLKRKEEKCVIQVRSEVQSIIDDSRDLLAMPDLDEFIITELEQVIDGMNQNIRHLDQGGSIIDLPHVFESIVVESAPSQPGKLDAPADSQDKNPNQQAKTQAKVSIAAETPAAGFWQRLRIWLNTPWSTSWKSIKRDKKNRKK